MAEAIISSRGGSMTAVDESVPTEGLINVNGWYQCTKSGNYFIQCIGGGGGSASGVCSQSGNTPYLRNGNFSYSNGGYSGDLNNASIYLNKGNNIQIIIGGGGSKPANYVASGNSGGTTSFGNYLYATGGNGGNGYYSGKKTTNMDNYFSWRYAKSNTFNDSSMKHYSEQEAGTNKSIYGAGGYGSYSYNDGSISSSDRGNSGNDGAVVIFYLDY